MPDLLHIRQPRFEQQIVAVVKTLLLADYWKRDRPYLDGIEYTVIPNRSTAILSFIGGKFDMTFPFEVTVPLRLDPLADPIRSRIAVLCAYADCLRPKLRWRGRRRALSRERCGQALIRHPDKGVHLAKFPGKLAPGIARIGAAEDLTVDAAGQQKIGVGSVRGQVPDRAVRG
jgi:hypothetical protein